MGLMPGIGERDEVARERSAPGAAAGSRRRVRACDAVRRVAGVGVVHLARIAAEIQVVAGHVIEGNVGVDRRGLVVGRAQEIPKEEELVLEDRTANRTACVVVHQPSIGTGREEVASVHAVVLHVLESRAVKAVGPRLQRYVHHGADSAAELRFEIVRGDVDVLNRRSRRNQNDVNSRALVIVNALDLVEVDVRRLPVRVSRKIVVRVKELRIVEDDRRHARHHVQQGLEAVAAAQRQVGNLALLNRRGNIGAVRLQLRRFAGNRNRLAGLAPPPAPHRRGLSCWFAQRYFPGLPGAESIHAHSHRVRAGG